MIELTRLNNTSFVLNCDLIETIEMRPDTTIFTVSGRMYIVKETVDEIVDKVIKYKSRILNEKIGI